MMNGGDLYELAKILGHSNINANIKMTERYAKLAKQHIARTSNTAREIWKLLETDQQERGCRVNRCTRIVRARKFECFWLLLSESIGGQGRNRTADAGLFRAAYRTAEVV
jgi:hypothetical protein